MSRNNFIIIFLLSISSLVAQNIIIGISPSVICNTVCTTVNFKYNINCRLPGHTTIMPAQPMIFKIVGEGLDTTISKKYSEFYLNGKHKFGIDTIYSFPICLLEAYIGNYTLSASGYCSTAFLGGSEKFKLKVIECGVVGMKEIEHNASEVKYYDLNGKEIPFTLNKIIIKRVGNKYTKIFVNG